VPSHATKTSFQPGNRGGPGRPRRDVAAPTANAVQRLARSFSEDALRILVGLMYDPDVHGNVRIKAAEAILNRAIGLPSQSMDVTIQRLIAKKLVELNIDELRQVEAALGELAIDITPTADTMSSEGMLLHCGKEH
jgi:hypothetical protein